MKRPFDADDTVKLFILTGFVLLFILAMAVPELVLHARSLRP